MGINTATRAKNAEDLRVDLEQALQMVGKAAGKDMKMTMTGALSWLRSRGAKSLAARLSRLSKGRNVLTHFDTELLQEIMVFASGTDDQISESSGGNSSTEHIQVASEERHETEEFDIHSQIEVSSQVTMDAN